MRTEMNAVMVGYACLRTGGVLSPRSKTAAAEGVPMNAMSAMGMTADIAAARKERVTLPLSRVEDSALKNREERPRASMMTP